MCNQPQSVTLQTAVLMQVKEFASNNSQFSVYDITTAIRWKTSQGELEIPEVEVTGESFRFDIPHTKVKALFDELWRTGVFDPDFTLSRKFNGTYLEYTPTPGYGAYVSPTSPQTTTASTTTAPRIWAEARVKALFSKVSRVGVETRIKTYLENCSTRHFCPTIKQVQSAIKRSNVSNGWTCGDIKEAIEKTGFKVIFDCGCTPVSLAWVQTL